MMATLSADAGTPAVAEPALSPLERAIAIFVRPTRAWSGLRERAQWWFPLIVMAVFGAVSSALIYQRAIVPTQIEAFEQQVANGQIQAEQLDQIEKFFTSPMGLAINIGAPLVLLPLLLLVVALFIWFGIGFVLGSGMNYRLALEIAAWSFLVRLPESIVFTALAWSQRTIRGIHTGFGILLPQPDTPSKMNMALGTFLDGLGPFAIWYLVVAVIGASTLSGANRRSVAWTLVVLYVVILVFRSALATLATPAA